MNSIPLQDSKIQSAKDSPATPPLTNERLPQNSNRPLGNSSSESFDHRPNQPPHCYDLGGLVSSIKPSSTNDARTETSSVDGSVRTSDGDQSEDLSVSNASDLETEWIEQDEPGVYITIRALPGGSRELRRIRFRYWIFLMRIIFKETVLFSCYHFGEIILYMTVTM